MKPYTSPEIASRNGDLSKEWYVYYGYLKPSTSVMQRFRVKGGINRIKTKAERMEAARALRNDVAAMLKKGYNPFEELDASKRAKIGQALSLQDGVNLFLEQHAKEQSERTYWDYKSRLNRLLEQLGPDTPVGSISRTDIRSALASMKKARGYNNTSRNNMLMNYRVFFNFLVREEIITDTPCKGIEDLATQQTDKNRPPTETEFEIIVNHLYKHDKPLFLYAMLIYFEGIRVSETGRLKREHLELNVSRPFLRLPSKFVKDNDIRIQFINPELLRYMKEMGIDKLAPDYYLFSTKLLPGKFMVKKIKDVVEDRWKRVVKDGLGFAVDLYSLKHKMATDLSENISENDIQQFLGHSDIETTRKYIKRHRPQVKYSFFENQRALPLK